jgi:hypothetical protein
VDENKEFKAVIDQQRHELDLIQWYIDVFEEGKDVK